MIYIHETLSQRSKADCEEREVLVAGVHDGNEGSSRVLLKCGFVETDSMGGLKCEEAKSGGLGDFTWFQFERPPVDC